jgi:hypothetical protein
MVKTMNSNYSTDNKAACEDLNLQIPCELVSRVRQYAAANKTSMTTVVIEALDAFLRINNN